MAEHIRGRVATSPADRLEDVGYLFVGEVVKVLDLDADYRQMRAVLGFVRWQAGGPDPSRRWARYTLTDLTGVEALIPLCGGADRFASRRRLNFRPAKAACTWLHGLGYRNPLLQVPMRLNGGRVFAEINQMLVEAGTGQLVLRGMQDRVEQHLASTERLSDGVRSAIADERLRQRSERPPRPKTRLLAIDAGGVPPLDQATRASGPSDPT